MTEIMDYPIELSARAVPVSFAQPLHGELANTITHGFGALLSVIAAAALLLEASRHGQEWLLIGCAIYSAAQIAVYSASTLSHAVQHPQRKDFLRSVDQATIYLMAGGSFTPFALAYTCTDSWWLLLVAMWAAVLIGFSTKVLWRHRVDRVSIPLYVTIGWMPLLSIQPAWEHAPLGALMWALAGGLCYTSGTWFLVRDTRHPAFHSVWHLLVIAGSTCHFVVIFKYVVGSAAVA